MFEVIIKLYVKKIERIHLVISSFNLLKMKIT